MTEKFDDSAFWQDYTVVFEISYTAILLQVHSRKLNLLYVSSDWIDYFRQHFRPLSVNVAVFYNTIIRPQGMYFTRNRHTQAPSTAFGI
jgi:hypothetical protein